MSWLDVLLFSITTVQVNGVQLPQERAINFAGSVTGADDPLNGRSVLTFTGGGGGGSSWTFLSSTTASHPTPSSALPMIFMSVDSSGGPYTQALPASPAANTIVQLKDIGATSSSSGIAANAVTISGGSISVQDQHTMAISGTTYTWGYASNDAGGGAIVLFYDGAAWVVIS